MLCGVRPGRISLEKRRLRGYLIAPLQLPERTLEQGGGQPPLPGNRDRMRVMASSCPRGGSGWVLGTISSPESSQSQLPREV